MPSNPNHIRWTDIGGVFVGTAYIFGDQTGNARGAGAIDVQAIRTNATQVASGANSAVFGNRSTASAAGSTASGYGSTASGTGSAAFGAISLASGANSAAFGNNATASADYTTASGYYAVASALNSTALGFFAHAVGESSTAIGYTTFANADDSTAVGYEANARITLTTNICGPQINRKDDGESAGTNLESFCGVQVVLMTNEVDLKVTASQTITIPTGAHFFPDECGVTVTSASGVIVQPSIRFGNSGNHATLLAITAGSGLTAAFARNRFQTLLTSAGQQDLVAEVTTGATATTLLGRFYFKGLLVEDE